MIPVNNYIFAAEEKKRPNPSFSPLLFVISAEGGCDE